YIFIASVSGSLVNILFSAFFTSSIGFLTPAFATLIQQIVVTILVILLSNKIEPVEFDLKDFVLNVIVLIVVSLVGLYYDILHPYGPIVWSNVFYKIFMFLIIVILHIYKY